MSTPGWWRPPARPSSRRPTGRPARWAGCATGSSRSWPKPPRLARDPAAHVALDDPYAVASLLDILMDIWPQPVRYEQAAALAARAAAHVALNDRDGVLKLLRTLRKASATDPRAAGVHE